MFLPESDVLFMYIPYEIPSKYQLRNFRRNVLFLMEETDNYNVAINLSRVLFINKRNLSFLIELTTKVKETGGSVVFYNINPTVSKTLLESGLHKFINIMNNENRVRAYFHQLLSA